MIEPVKAAMRELLASDRSEKTIAEAIRPFKRAVDRNNYSEGFAQSRNAATVKLFNHVERCQNGTS